MDWEAIVLEGGVLDVSFPRFCPESCQSGLDNDCRRSIMISFVLKPAAGSAFRFRWKLAGKEQTAFKRVNGGQRTSAVDDIHEISGWIAEKETAKSPRFLDRAVNYRRASSADSSLGGAKIIHSD